ncbi:ATP-binding protein [Actinoplanes couchii]|uniref:Histidine kinase/HSP90-like ATPase domain-containing protein n=1 Tax=Actinoplanes couchii TaxID=403638 RepID=A0ABQ3XJ19_9ACTN|nr:ATP-binding protein [Actinoplanes couchii]MDR6324499.1 anti-sigma regulatory factor (Ser/Thr protein kinase) [Actinoplanes couchii]GID58501.1 hypothetical protein Aco03nite_069050 [Actinoplanes couchii]
MRAGLIGALNEHTRESLSDIPDRMILVVTEPVNNALRHGLAPTVVRLLPTGDRFVLDVADHDLSTLPELADIQQADAGGRGLHLARAFASIIGWYTADTAKRVWASFLFTP